AGSLYTTDLIERLAGQAPRPAAWVLRRAGAQDEEPGGSGGEARRGRRLGQMSRTHSLPRGPRAKKEGRPQEARRAAKGSEVDKGWCRHEQGLNDSESS